MADFSARSDPKHCIFHTGFFTFTEITYFGEESDLSELELLAVLLLQENHWSARSLQNQNMIVYCVSKKAWPIIM